MIKLGLIGSDIAHSQSPSLYRQFLGPQIQYDLLDIASDQDLPSVERLKADGYLGFNITTPWKEHYCQFAIEKSRQWKAVNCVKLSGEKIEATNTDASALVELVPLIKKDHSPVHWVVLGSGVMARMILIILAEHGIKAANYTRKKDDDITRLNLSELHSGSGTKLVINACGRSYNFAGKLDGTWVFWDFNYAHSVHERTLPSVCKQYINGLSLLETQARHAVKFWDLQV